MEVEKLSRKIVKEDDEEDDDARLPGFRFHPTDEELVGFYLRRKVENRPISLELIKEANIYKYEPWDLPSMSTESSNGGDKEWYFFCKRGRKYKNSIRPNRVTGSGFWKATGIDRPIYSSSVEGKTTSHCIGLKKSLVYYRGSAGKGTKTDWMMHEFRLPPKHVDAKAVNQEAEVWTLCRILKRSASYRKIIPDWKQAAAAKRNGVIINPRAIDASSETCSMESSVHQTGQSSSNYIRFSAVPATVDQVEKKPYSGHILNQQVHLGLNNSAPSAALSTYMPPSVFSAYGCGDLNEILRQAEWEDLQALAESAAAAAVPPALYYPFNL